MSYSTDKLKTPKEHAINSLVMEQASAIAEELTGKEWEASDRPENLWIDEGEGNREYNAEAQDIYNAHYDKYTDEIYKFINAIIKEHLLTL